MGEYWTLLNQSAQLVGGAIGGKWQEFLFYPESALSIIKHLQTWQNPFPNMEAVLELIERDRAKRGEGDIVERTEGKSSTDTRCRLLELPEDVLRTIFIQARGYEDLLSLSATCMAMLRLLAPKTAEVRRNFEEDLGPPRHQGRSWNGERIVILGENYRYTEYISFIKNNIRAAFEKRGITDLDEETLEAISDVDSFVPHQDVYDGDENDLDEDGDLEIAVQGVEYQSARSTQIARSDETEFLLEHSHFDFVKGRFVKPDLLLELQRFEADNPEPKMEDYRDDILDYFDAHDDWAHKVEKMKALKDDWKQVERARNLHRRKYRHMPLAEDDTQELRAFRGDVGEANWRWMAQSTRKHFETYGDDYHVVNLDTREFIRSATILAHRLFESIEGAPFTAAFVLMTNITFSHDGLVEGDDNLIYGGRWAGNRLYMIVLSPIITHEDQALLDSATDISLELLDRTHRLCAANLQYWDHVEVPGYRAGDANVQPDQSEAKPLRRSDRIRNMSAS